MKLKWYHRLLIILLAVLAFGLGYFWRWWTSPLGCPMCICKNGPAALPGDYTNYWQYIKVFGMLALVEGGLIFLLMVAIAWKFLLIKPAVINVENTY